MCPAKCHFGPCLPCSREVGARCRCGRIRRQLPCAEVWVFGKQTFLDCTIDCQEVAAAAEATQVEVLDAAGSAPVERPPEVSKDELRERRKDRRKQRDEETEER